jgi:hypothetical protein
VWAKITPHMQNKTVNSECGMPIVACVGLYQSDNIALHYLTLYLCAFVPATSRRVPGACVFLHVLSIVYFLAGKFLDLFVLILKFLLLRRKRKK